MGFYGGFYYILRIQQLSLWCLGFSLDACFSDYFQVYLATALLTLRPLAHGFPRIAVEWQPFPQSSYAVRQPNQGHIRKHIIYTLIPRIANVSLSGSSSVCGLHNFVANFRNEDFGTGAYTWWYDDLRRQRVYNTFKNWTTLHDRILNRSLTQSLADEREAFCRHRQEHTSAL